MWIAWCGWRVLIVTLNIEVFKVLSISNLPVILFYKPYLGLLVHFQSPVVPLLGRTACFDLALARAAFNGVVQRGGFSYHKVFNRHLERLAYAHWCLVLQGWSQHLGYLLSLSSHPCLILAITLGICSYREGPFLSWCLWRFRRRLQSDQQIFSLLPRDLDW